MFWPDTPPSIKGDAHASVAAPFPCSFKMPQALQARHPHSRLAGGIGGWRKKDCRFTSAGKRSSIEMDKASKAGPMTDHPHCAGLCNALRGRIR
jgi:hypothetical protein